MARIERGQVIAALSGLALIGAMFLPWFDAPGAAGSRTAWQAFAAIDLVLLIAAASPLLFAAIAATRTSVSLPVAGHAISAAFAIVALLMALYRAIDPVDDLEPDLGLYIGLLALAGAIFGGYLGMQEDQPRSPNRDRPLGDRLPG